MTTPAQSKPRSRRALLAGALGGLGAWAATAVGRANPVRGAGDDGTAIEIGGLYANAQSQTTLANQANNERVLWVASNGGGGGGAGVAITGFSQSGVGVEGWSNNVRGVYGHALSSGVEGEATMGNGVYGHSSGTNQRGVYGKAEGGGGSIGVEGWTGSSSGTGVLGFCGSLATGQNYGVRGYSASPTGIGVAGQGTTGVLGVSSGTAGIALQANGRTNLSTSGVATITAGSTSKTITPGVDVTTASFVLLTPKANIGSRALWFTTDATNNKFTIRMSSARSSGTKVAWLLLG
jgi:hypothetical protein